MRSARRPFARQFPTIDPTLFRQLLRHRAERRGRRVVLGWRSPGGYAIAAAEPDGRSGFPALAGALHAC
jgi:hypothetical protein